MFKNILTMSD